TERGEGRGARGEREPNPLPALERWKVLDNLRSSLVPPTLVACLALGWLGALPAGATLGVVLAVLFLPAALLLLGTVLQTALGKGVRAGWHHAGAQLGPTLAQGALAGVFLAEQATYLVDAVIRTLARLFVTRRRLLEWETSAATE